MEDRRERSMSNLTRVKQQVLIRLESVDLSLTWVDVYSTLYVKAAPFVQLRLP